MRAFRNPDHQRAVGVNNEADGWKWWVRQHELRFVEMITEGLNCQIVWPERMVDGDYRQLYETIEWLGLKWNSDVLSFIDPKLWKSRNKYNPANAKLARDIKDKVSAFIDGTDAIEQEEVTSGEM